MVVQSPTLTITVLPQEYTLTINVTPTSGKKGTVFNFTGTLTKNSTKQYNQYIALILEGYGQVADAATDANGNYSCLWLSDREGTLKFHTEAPWVAGVRSAVLTISVGEPDYMYWLAVGSLGALAIIVVAGVILHEEYG
jgi:hypothetical protein